MRLTRKISNIPNTLPITSARSSNKHDRSSYRKASVASISIFYGLKFTSVSVRVCVGWGWGSRKKRFLWHRKCCSRQNVKKILSQTATKHEFCLLIWTLISSAQEMIARANPRPRGRRTPGGTCCSRPGGGRLLRDGPGGRTNRGPEAADRAQPQETFF